MVAESSLLPSLLHVSLVIGCNTAPVRKACNDEELLNAAAADYSQVGETEGAKSVKRLANWLKL